MTGTSPNEVGARERGLAPLPHGHAGDGVPRRAPPRPVDRWPSRRGHGTLSGGGTHRRDAPPPRLPPDIAPYICSYNHREGDREVGAVERWSLVSRNSRQHARFWTPGVTERRRTDAATYPQFAPRDDGNHHRGLNDAPFHTARDESNNNGTDRTRRGRWQIHWWA